MIIGSRTTGGVADIRVLTGGTGYVSPPQVVIAGGGGTGATAVAVMAGTRVDSVIITNPGTGYTASPTISFSATTGSSAAATAYAYTGALQPLSFFKGRFGTLYGVDGMGRGVRWEGGTAAVAPIGLHKPAVGPAVTASSSSPGQGVVAIQLVEGGRGYASVPSVSITGGTPTRPAAAQAVIVNGRVSGVRVTDPGAGYQGTPSVAFSGGMGTGATFSLGAVGRVSQLRVISAGTGYDAGSTDAPSLTVATSNGLTDFLATITVDTQGRVVGGVILNGGTGATTTPVFSVTALTGSGAVLAADMSYSVNAVTVGNSGSGFFTPPIITIRPSPEDQSGGGADTESAVDGDGHVASVTVIAGGQYQLPPAALFVSTEAKAQASVAEPLRGKYKCAIRYLDATDAEVGGPLASSISHLVELDAGDGEGEIVWSFSHPYVDARVHAMELWRTSGDQEILLFRVATIYRTDPNWDGTYADSLTDADLTDPARDGYGLMPITLPSGQINARRFEVPTGRMSVAVMFQDRAWYAVDSSGLSPNSLFYSEIDEPESVPGANELVLQENTDTPDRIVALVPLGSALLAVQTSHLYRLMYVAQPVLDASIMLMVHRGVLNSRCWAVMAGVAFLADSVGMYAFDGNQEQSISAPVDDYWREAKIDFSKSSKFHVDADHLTRTVRFYYCRTSDQEPTRALCYCTATQAWWEEVYATAVTATTATPLGGQRRRALGGADGAWRKEAGTQDGTSGVEYAYRSGNLSLDNDPDRSIAILYEPTASSANLELSLRYNNSQTARANAIQSDRGAGFTVSAGGPATLNMQKTRSALGDATGQAVAHYAGRKSDRSAGGDQHVSVQVAGTQSGDNVKLYGLRVSGVQ
jgi:hypothetical protein